MKIEKIELFHVKLPFKTKFKHSLKIREFTENIIIKIYSENEVGIGESLPREYVTNETPITVIQTLERKIIPYFKKLIFNDFEDILIAIEGFLLNLNKNELSAFSAFEQALLNLSSKIYNKELEDILKYLKIPIKKKNFIEYSAVLGSSSKIKLFLKVNIIKLFGFKHLKIKIADDNFNNINLVRKFLKNIDIRVDGNKDFNISNISKVLRVLVNNNVRFFEQPFNPDDKNKKQIYNECFVNNIKVILDESLCTYEDRNKLLINKIGDIANIRISKNGGIINSLKIFKYCYEYNIPVILGCLVGETILTKYNILLGQYMETIYNEGDYDKFLFKKPILKNPNFQKNGILKNIEISLNFKVTLNNNFKEFIIEEKIYEND